MFHMNSARLGFMGADHFAYATAALLHPLPLLLVTTLTRVDLAKGALPYQRLQDNARITCGRCLLHAAARLLNELCT